MAEGWEWVQIQAKSCPQCGQNPASARPTELGAAGVAESVAWRSFLLAADDNYLRTNPTIDVWSPLQYGMHVRDMLRVFGDRILLAIRDDNPTVPWFDPGAEGWRRYNEMNPSDVAAEVDRQAERLAVILEDCQESDWDRRAMRDGVDSFTVAGMACFAVHEAHHHLLDADGELAAR